MADNTGSAAADDFDDLNADALEDAYLRALEAMETADWALNDSIEEEVLSDTVPDDAAAAAQVTSPAAVHAGVEVASNDFLGSSDLISKTDADPADDQTVTNSEQLTSQVSAPAASTPTSAPPVKPSRAIEACLFVGGQPLSARKLANILDSNNDPARIEKIIDELNVEYSAQARPYEIRLGDGGYRLTLRSEFDVVRGRVYGVGPRDVKLSQDVLEILALVAYQQPITPSAIEACKPNSTNILRQLLRRELISLTRVEQGRNGIEYRTTPRFLQLFGLGQLSELPRPEDLSIR